MKKRHVLCIIAACVCVIGNLIEYICTNELPYRVNQELSISLFTLIVFGLICKPAGDWLNEPLYKPEPKKVTGIEPTEETKNQIKSILRKFGPNVDTDTKALFWYKFDTWLILWKDKYLFYSDDDTCDTFKSIKHKFTDDELQEFISEWERLILKHGAAKAVGNV